MRDYNFFEPYLYSVKTRNNGRIFTIVLMLLLVGSVIGIFGYNFQRINALELEKAKLNQQLEELNASETLSKVNQLNGKLKTIDEKSNAIGVFGYLLDEMYVINQSLMDDVFSLIPRDMYIEEFDIGGNAITMVGFAYDRSIIAEYEYALRMAGDYQGMYVNVIEDSTGNGEDIYTFTINFLTTGVK